MLYGLTLLVMTLLYLPFVRVCVVLCDAALSKLLFLSGSIDGFFAITWSVAAVVLCCVWPECFIDTYS